MKRNAPLTAICQALLGLENLSKASLEGLIQQMKSEKQTVPLIIQQLTQEPPARLPEVLKNLCYVTGSSFQALVPDKLKNKLTNGERNSISGTMAKPVQQQIWTALWKEVQPNAQFGKTNEQQNKAATVA